MTPAAATTAWAAAAWQAEGVAVADKAQAQRLHQRTSCGRLQADGRLVLHPVEAAWLAADGRLAVTDPATAAGGPSGTRLGLADLLAKGPAGGRAAERDYLVYRDLRERGLVARPRQSDAGMFDVWARGAAADAGPALAVRACADADGILASDLLAAARAKVVLSVVDADSQLRQYQASLVEPRGDVPEGDLPRAKGQVLADRVLVADAAAAEAYHRREALGTPHPGGLLLSFLEAEALRARGVLAVPTGLAGRTPEAGRLAQVYRALRAAGAVPKSGFRFGAPLRAYRGAPDDGHAEWLVHVAAPEERLPWDVVSRGVRLAHGVRKAFLVAVTGAGKGGADPVFAQLSWHRL